MRFKPFVCIGLVGALLFSNGGAVYSAESNFWSERRAHARPTSPRLAGGGQGDPTSLILAQWPGAQPVGLDVSGSIPFPSAAPSFLEKNLTENISRVPGFGTPGLRAAGLDSLVNPYGHVREIHLSKNPDSPLIIQIQDVHGNGEAQQNIAALLGVLAQDRGVGLVGMEAAEGAFALDDLRRYPDRGVQEKVTDWALKKDLIGGAEKSGILSKTPLTLWGVEDTSLYQANVRAVKDSLARRSEARAIHDQWVKQADALKNVVYSPEMKKFDENILAYREQRRGLADYLRSLASQSLEGRRALHDSSPHVARLMEAFDRESALDFKQVERERQGLVDRLGTRLDEKMLNGLVQESLAYRAGRVGSGRYYAFVESLCRKVHIPLALYPSLTHYMEYVGLSEKINRSELLIEMERWEEAVAHRLAVTEAERDVWSLSRDCELVGKLVNNAMTPEEWARYLARRNEILDFESRVRSLEMSFYHSEVADRNKKGIHSSPWGRKWGGVSDGGQVSVNNIPSPSPANGKGNSLRTGKELQPDGAIGVSFHPTGSEDLPEFMKPFEEFCRLALARNGVLIERLLAKMRESHVSTAVLVAGGFHTEGLTEMIQRRGGSSVVLTPRMEIVPGNQNYLDVFAQDPLPLEKLFDGEKISILTARGTTVAALQSDAVSATEKMALAMGLNQVGGWFQELRTEGRPLTHIRDTLQRRWGDHVAHLGAVFQRMDLTVGSVRPDGVLLNAREVGKNVEAFVADGGGVQVFDPSPVSWAGFQNTYLIFERTPLGRWLKRNNVVLFKSVAEIFFAPFLEKPFTADLVAWGKSHHFASLPVSPLGWVGMVLDKSIDWQEVTKSSLGWLAIGLVAVAGFTPTIGTLYFTFVGPVDLVRISLGLFLVPWVVWGNYRWKTQAYILPHGLVNILIISINGVLAGINRVVPRVTFRLSRLTLENYSFIVPARGIDRASKERFLDFLENFGTDPSVTFPTLFDSNMSPGLYQLVYLLADEAYKQKLDVSLSDEDTHSAIAELGRSILEKIRLNEIWRLVRPNPPYNEWVLSETKYAEAPSFSPETPGMVVAERFDDGSAPEFYAQVYDEWIRRCFFVALRDKSSVDEEKRNTQIWFDLIHELAEGSGVSDGTRWNTKTFKKGVQLYYPYIRPFQVVLSPGPFEVVLTIYSQEDLPDVLRSLALQKGIPPSEYYLVRYSDYGDGMMGLNQVDDEVVIGVEKGELFSVVETNSILYDHLRISYQDHQLAFYEKPRNPGPALQIRINRVTKTGEQIQRELKFIKEIQEKEAQGGALATENEKQKMANIFWGLKVRLDEYGPRAEDLLGKEGLSRDEVNLFLQIVRDTDLLERIREIDRESIQYLKDLEGLVIVMDSPGGYRRVNVEGALAGIDVLQTRWRGAYGFDIRNDNGLFKMYLTMRTGLTNLGARLSEPAIKKVLIAKDMTAFRYRVQMRQDLEWGFELYRPFVEGRGDPLREEQFERAVTAHRRLWRRIVSDLKEFSGIKDPDARKEILLKRLWLFGLFGMNHIEILNYLMARDQIEERIALREREISEKSPSPLVDEDATPGASPGLVGVPSGNEDVARMNPGAWRVWEKLGVRNLSLAGVLESIVTLVTVHYLIPVNLGLGVSEGLLHGGMALLDVSGAIIMTLVVANFLIHFFGGVSQPGEAPPVTWGQNGIRATFLAAWGATLTASKSLVMVPFLVGSVLAPIPGAAALILASVGFIGGTYLHAMANYRMEVSSLNALKLGEGLSVLSYPVNAEGDFVRSDPRASFMGLLHRVVLGGPAAPAYRSVEGVVYSVRVKGVVVAERMAGPLLGDKPGHWVAQQALVGMGLKESAEMSEQIEFLNLVVQFHRRMVEKVIQAQGPVVIEVPALVDLDTNSTARMALAAAVMAHGQLGVLGSRPLVLVARAGLLPNEKAWSSVESFVEKTAEVIGEFSPDQARLFTAKVQGQTVSVALASGDQLNGANQFRLAEILRHALHVGENENILAPLVLGEKGHFDQKGLNDIFFISYLSLASNLRRAMEKIVLFAIAA